MFNKKKNKPVESWADTKMRELHYRWHDAQGTLTRKAKQAYIKAEALKVYDLGEPDGKRAKKDLEEAKYSLLCSIGEYDGVVAEMKRLVKEYGNEMQKNWNINFYTSHEQIEWAIREVLKGN